MVSVDIGGYSPALVLDYEIGAEAGDELDYCEVTVPNDSATRSAAAPSTSITLSESGVDTFVGEVSGRPSPQDDRLVINGLGKRRGLLHREAHQVLYDVRSSEAVKTLATEQAKALPKTPIHVGSDLTDWSFSAPVSQLYSGARAGLYDWGTDLVFVGARSGYAKPLTATYGNVTDRAIEDGIFELDTRLLINDAGNIFDLEVELVTPGGTTYVWEPEIPTTGFHTYRLKAEDATTDGQVSESGTLQYRFVPSGQLAQNTGIWIDSAHTIPFRRGAAPNAPSTGGVQQTDRRVTRRIDGPVAAVLSDLATEDQFDWWIESDDLHYQPDRGVERGLSIDTSTPVIETDVDRDFESIRNEVTVIGAGDIEATVRDQSSIQFYGERITLQETDRTLQSEVEARARAEGILADRAFDDTLATFVIGDRSYRQLTAGQRVNVDWPRQDLSGTFEVDTLTIDDSTVAVTIAASAQS